MNCATLECDGCQHADTCERAIIHRLSTQLAEAQAQNVMLREALEKRFACQHACVKRHENGELGPEHLCPVSEHLRQAALSPVPPTDKVLVDKAKWERMQATQTELAELRARMRSITDTCDIFDARLVELREKLRRVYGATHEEVTS